MHRVVYQINHKSLQNQCRQVFSLISVYLQYEIHNYFGHVNLGRDKSLTYDISTEIMYQMQKLRNYSPHHALRDNKETVLSH